MTINTPTVQLFLSIQQHDHASLRNGLAIQILPSVESLPRCFKHQFAAFIRNQGCLVVWDDDPDHLVSRVAELESLLLLTIWNTEAIEDTDEKKCGNQKEENIRIDEVIAVDQQNEKEVDLEALTPEPRSIVLWSPVMVAGTLVLICSAIGTGLRSLALETAVDGTYIRFALLAPLPIIFFMGLVSYVRVHLINSSLIALLVYDAKSDGMSHANVWPCQSDDEQFQSILWKGTTSNTKRHIATYHDSNARVQGRSCSRHSSNHYVSQGGNFHL